MSYFPWYVAAVFLAVIAVSRLLTNYYVRMRYRQILTLGLQPGFCPPWVSAVFLLGHLGLLVFGIWSFKIGWWAPIPLVAVYYVQKIAIPSPMLMAIQEAEKQTAGALHRAPDPDSSRAGQTAQPDELPLPKTIAKTDHTVLANVAQALNDKNRTGSVIGAIHRNELDAAKNQPQAAPGCSNFAALGDKDAEVKMGWICAVRQGIQLNWVPWRDHEAKDEAQAVAWYREAAEQVTPENRQAFAASLAAQYEKYQKLVELLLKVREGETVLFHRAIAHLEKGEYDQAIADSTEAIRLDPRKNSPYVVRSCAYRLKGQNDQAIADCTEAIRLNPKTSFAFFNRGEAYLEKGEYDRAIADSTEAIRLEAKHALAFGTRAGAYLKKEEYDQAIADCTEAIRLNPKCQCAYERRGEAHLWKGVAADPKNPKAQRAEFDRAIADCTEAIRLEPIDTFAYQTRFMAYVWKGMVACLSKGESDLAEADFKLAARARVRRELRQAVSSPQQLEGQEKEAQIKAARERQGEDNMPELIWFAWAVGVLLLVGISLAYVFSGDKDGRVRKDRPRIINKNGAPGKDLNSGGKRP